jgi:tetratricopeptide (TPR) repeat protein
MFFYYLPKNSGGKRVGGSTLYIGLLLFFLIQACRPQIDHWKIAQQEFAEKDFLGTILELNQYLMDENQEHYIDALILRARCYNKIGKHKKAEQDLNRVLNIAPDNEVVHLEFARLKLYTGDTATALRLLSTLQSGSGRIVSDAWIEKGKIHFKKGMYSQAFTEINWAVQADSSNEYAWYYKGAFQSSFVASSDSSNRLIYPYLNFDEASVAFLETIKISPEFSDAWYKLGLVYLNQFKGEEGVNCLNRAIQLDSLNPGFFAARAEYYMNKGDRKAALDDYVKLLKFNPFDEEAQRRVRELNAANPK